LLFAVIRGVTWLKLEAECAWHWLCFAVALMLAFDSFHANHVTHRFLMIWLHTSFWEHAVRGLSRLLLALSVIRCHCWINPFLGQCSIASFSFSFKPQKAFIFARMQMLLLVFRLIV
jgi:hypothetical protein